jgi:PIN domain-containing protein
MAGPPESLDRSRENLGIYDEFLGHRLPSEIDLNDALRTALVVIDANVLLNLYRYAEATFEDLVGVMRSLGDRLWVPHQAIREFWRNRLSVIGSRGAGTEQTLNALTKQSRASIDTVNIWAKSVAIPAEDRKTMHDQIIATYSEISDLIRERTPTLSTVGPNGEDPILAILETLLEGKVGRGLTPDEWKAAVAEGKSRVDRKEPPGYLDAAKADSDLPEGAAGDYLVWFQALREARRRDCDVIIVTGDEKEDWWWKYKGQFLGPNEQLAAEFNVAVADRRLFMMRPSDLLLRANAVEVTVNSASVDDVERVSREVSSERSLWTPTAVFALLETLAEEGWDQAEVIRTAAERGGIVDRDTVYELCGYNDDRMLRGFTRPSARITADLQRRGLVASDVDPALTALYEGGVKAVTFKIPNEMVSILAEDKAPNDSITPTEIDEPIIDRPESGTP